MLNTAAVRHALLSSTLYMRVLARERAQFSGFFSRSFVRVKRDRVCDFCF